jgi:hypothetical protein
MSTQSLVNTKEISGMLLTIIDCGELKDTVDSIRFWNADREECVSASARNKGKD